MKQAAFSSFAVLMRPIAKLMLSCGVSWKELAELSKRTYVEVAGEKYGKHGRPANASRVAILTGLSRREVKRLRDALALDGGATLESLGQIDYTTRVLSGWHQDPAFCDAQGKPKLLEQQGAVSFAALAKRYAPDIPRVAMLKELKRVGAVRETPSGRLRAVARVIMHDDQNADSVLRGGAVIADFANTVTYNQSRGDRPSNFERRATNLRVKRSARRTFREYLEQRGMEFLEDVDQWLTDHESSAREEGTVRLGVGVYFITDD